MGTRWLQAINQGATFHSWGGEKGAHASCKYKRDLHARLDGRITEEDLHVCLLGKWGRAASIRWDVSSAPCLCWLWALQPQSRIPRPQQPQGGITKLLLKASELSSWIPFHVELVGFSSDFTPIVRCYTSLTDRRKDELLLAEADITILRMLKKHQETWGLKGIHTTLLLKHEQVQPWAVHSNNKLIVNLWFLSSQGIVSTFSIAENL